ncbi:MAG: Flp pilus assembly protein CpaB [Betaproteobacteria bacterium]|nr:Flp pilus assembly protein CpaB [Betaproteobacteria bacterium]
MNNAWLLRILALILALGAVGAAVIGYRLSTAPAPRPASRAAVSQVVEAKRNLLAGAIVQPGDVALEAVAQPPLGSFSSTAAVVGKTLATDVLAGTALQSPDLAVLSPLAEDLHPGERAVAIRVDDVVGLGGFARPGDAVDVLLYLRAGQETANVSSAQMVLENVRLLAYGSQLQTDQPASDKSVLSRAGRSDAAKTGGPQTGSLSAVLAVPAGMAAKLMLASNSGLLRLALRPAASAAGGKASHVEPDRFVRLAELTGAQVRPAGKPYRARSSVVVYAGDSAHSIPVDH